MTTVTVGTNDTADNTGDLIVTFVDASPQGVTTDGTRPPLPGAPWGCYLIAPSISPQTGCVVTLTPTSAQWESCSLIWQPPPHAAILWTSGGLASGSGGVVSNPKWPPQTLPAAGEMDAAGGMSGRISVRRALATTAPGAGNLSGATRGRLVAMAAASGSGGVIGAPTGPGTTAWPVAGLVAPSAGIAGRAFMAAAIGAAVAASAGVSGNAARSPKQWPVAGEIDGGGSISGSPALGHQYFVAGRPAAATAITFSPTTPLRVINYVRNPRPEMNQGASTLPAEWFCFDNSGEASTQAVIGTGTESQIPYIDFQIAGTGSAGGYTFFQTETEVFTSAGTTWSYSQFLRLVGGSLTNISQIALIMFTANSSTGSGIAAHIGASITPTSAGLVTQNFAYNGQLLNDAGMDSFGCGLYIVHGVGAFSLTLRTGGPKAENISASSPASCLVVPQTGLVPPVFGSTSFVY
jgi:hypothetical protein